MYNPLSTYWAGNNLLVKLFENGYSRRENGPIKDTWCIQRSRQLVINAVNKKDLKLLLPHHLSDWPKDEEQEVSPCENHWGFCCPDNCSWNQLCLWLVHFYRWPGALARGDHNTVYVAIWPQRIIGSLGKPSLRKSCEAMDTGRFPYGGGGSPTFHCFWGCFS